LPLPGCCQCGVDRGSGIRPEDPIAVAREVERLSRTWGLAPYQVALAWLLSRPAVASAIVGAETIDELRANATAADVALEPAQLDALTALASEPAAFHHRAGHGPERPAATTGSTSTS
jgi:1-deoxyxylulose-5-phosphate synthase